MNNGIKSVLGIMADQTKKMDAETEKRLKASLANYDDLAEQVDRAKEDVAQKRANYEAHMSEFLSIESSELARVEKELASRTVTERDVKEKRVSLTEFFARGTSRAVLEKQAAVSVSERTEFLSAILRKEKLALLEAERDLTKLQSELAQKRLSVPTIRTAVLSEFAGELSRNLSHLWHEARESETAYNEARGRLKAAKGLLPNGVRTFDGMNPQKVRALFCEPGLEKFRPGLQEILEYAVEKKLESFSFQIDMNRGAVVWLQKTIDFPKQERA